MNTALDVAATCIICYLWIMVLGAVIGDTHTQRELIWWVAVIVGLFGFVLWRVWS